MSIVSIIAAILIFGILIFVHEFGHFVIARKNGIRVIEFAIGLGPTIFKIKGKKGTTYCVKPLPFGGYCRMQGFEDEGIDDEAGGELVADEAFSSKSVWGRMAVVTAGPIFNFILAFVLAVIVIGIVGYDPAKVIGVAENSPATEAGLEEGDIITEYNGEKIVFGREIMLEDYIHPVDSDDGIKIKFIRDGEKNETTLYPKLVKKYAIGFEYSKANEKAVISNVVEGGALEKAGVLAGDIIVSVNGTEINSSEEIYNYFITNPLSEEPITMKLSRDGKEYEISVTPAYSTEYYRVGFNYNTYREKTNAWGVIKYSYYEVKYQIKTVFKCLGMLFTGKLTANDFAGPVGITDVINDTYEASKDDGWLYVFLNFANLTIMISANLGVMNLLPIPGLDGGRLLFLIIEAIRRKPIDRKKEGIVHLVGMLLLMAFAIYVLFHDISRLF